MSGNVPTIGRFGGTISLDRPTFSPVQTPGVQAPVAPSAPAAPPPSFVLARAKEAAPSAPAGKDFGSSISDKVRGLAQGLTSPIPLSAGSDAIVTPSKNYP